MSKRSKLPNKKANSKVKHDFADEGWKTTFSTQARILPDNKLQPADIGVGTLDSQKGYFGEPIT